MYVLFYTHTYTTHTHTHTHTHNITHIPEFSYWISKNGVLVKGREEIVFTWFKNELICEQTILMKSKNLKISVLFTTVPQCLDQPLAQNCIQTVDRMGKNQFKIDLVGTEKCLF